MEAFRAKNWILLLVSVAIVCIGKFFTPIAELSAEANTALFYMLSLVILIATETLPAGLTGIAAVVFLPILGLTDSLAAASTLFGNQLFFYTLACFGISTIMSKLPIGNRILLVFLRKARTTKGVITAMLATGAILSSCISNFSAALLILMIAKQYLNMVEDETACMRLKGSLMIGIILCVGIGGVVTPVGNSGNVLVSTYLSEAGYTVTFLQWMAFGLPIALVWLPLALFILFQLFPPPEQDTQSRLLLIDKVKATVPDKYSSQEILAVVILVVTFVCWILNFNVMIVSCCCCIALLFPGFGLISWKEFNDSVGWGSLIMICGLVAVVGVLSSTGVIPWLIGLFTSVLPSGAGAAVLLVFMGVFIPFMLVLVPNAPALVAVLGAALIPMAESLSIHPVILLLGFCVFVAIECVIPVGSLTLIIYEGGKNFRAKDMPKAAIPIVVCSIALSVIWLPVCGKLLGIA